MSSIYEWSLKADENANSDSLINWAHGQPPSSVNGSARAMMQRVAEYLRDLSGLANVSGDGNNIVINASSQLSSYIDGVRFYFRAIATNSSQMKIRLGGLQSLPVYQTEASGLCLSEAGACQKGGLYEIIYCSTLGKDNKPGWFLANPTIKMPQSNLPAGLVVSYCKEKYDGKNWLLCDGQEYSKRLYPDLYGVIGDLWGKASKGPDYFMVPDFRGVFLRGFDAGKGLDAGRKFASFQDSGNKKHNHDASCDDGGLHNHKVMAKAANPPYEANSAYAEHTSGKAAYYMATPPILKDAGVHKHKVTIANSGGAEARPCNYAVSYMIKT